jgi:D-alanyl-D-alanine carboxypeptidase/D-alanyl-D-alanine-endopeptidase (penicillin-binding protein 4)
MRFSQSFLIPRPTRHSIRRIALSLALAMATTLLGVRLELPASADDRGYAAVLAVRGDETLVSTNPDRLLAPASLQKMIVVAAALHYLGPEHRFATLLRGELQDGQDRIGGDLFVVAGGDPTWSERFRPEDPRSGIRELVEGLQKRGITRISGDLVIDTSRFPGRSMPKSRAFDEVAFAMGSPTSALAIDENTVEVRIAPGIHPGKPGSLDGPADLQWIHHIVTVGEERHEKGTVDFLPRWGSREIYVHGEYPVTEPSYRIPVSVPNPVERAGSEISRLLGEHGIELEGELCIDDTASPADLPELARSLSPTVAELVIPILQESVNWLAEMLLRLLAAELTGEARSDTGIEILGRFLEEEVGIDKSAFHLDDASGVSPYNLISVGALVELLGFVDRQEWRVAFANALATPGEGTLETWPPLPKLLAKTGTLRHTSALAGFLEPGGESRIAFAIVLDHRTEEQAELRQEIARFVTDLARQNEAAR